MEQTGILRLASSRYLNPNAGCGDTVPGATVAGYTGQQPLYSGQLGAVALYSWADAQKRSDPLQTAFSCQGGRYQYVLFAASGTAYAAGQILYWSDETAYTVSNVPPTNLNIAGVCLTLVTQGTYWVMQTDGVAPVLFASGLTSPALGESIHANNATPSLGVNSATTTTAIVAGGNAVGLISFLGVPKIAPVSSTISLVYLRGITQVQ